MSSEGKSPRVQVGKEPKNRTKQHNMKKNQITTTAGKEDVKDSTATQQRPTTTSEEIEGKISIADRTTATGTTTSNMAAMEDDADSIATMTTATFTSVNESEWE